MTFSLVTNTTLAWQHSDERYWVHSVVDHLWNGNCTASSCCSEVHHLHVCHKIMKRTSTTYSVHYLATVTIRCCANTV